MGAMVVAGVDASARAEPAINAVSAKAEAERSIVFMVQFPYGAESAPQLRRLFSKTRGCNGRRGPKFPVSEHHFTFSPRPSGTKRLTLRAILN